MFVFGLLFVFFARGEGTSSRLGNAGKLSIRVVQTRQEMRLCSVQLVNQRAHCPSDSEHGVDVKPRRTRRIPY